MRESPIISHRFADCQDNLIFLLEDGIDVFGGRAAIPTCLNCSHRELSIDEKEAVDPSITESHKKPHFPTCLHNLKKDLL